MFNTIDSIAESLHKSFIEVLDDIQDCPWKYWYDIISARVFAYGNCSIIDCLNLWFRLEGKRSIPYFKANDWIEVSTIDYFMLKEQGH